MATRFIILGCGNTGTTLLSGVFHTSGFPSLQVNHHFESQPLLDLNVRLLDELERETDHGMLCEQRRTVYTDYENYFQSLERRTRGKWCIKDPVLSLTIHKIYDLIPAPVKILFNFRHPGNTVSHLMKPRRRVFPSMSDAEVQADAEREWYERNASTLDFLRQHPEVEYLMVNYDDLVDRRLDDVINRFVGRRMNYGFIRPSMRRSPRIDVGDQLLGFYEELLVLYRTNLAHTILNTASVEPGRLTRLVDQIGWRKSLCLAVYPGRVLRRLSAMWHSR